MTAPRFKPKPKDVGTIYMGYAGQWMIVTATGVEPYRRAA